MRRSLATLACFAALAPPAFAAEFVPGFDVLGAWDSNVFRVPTGAEQAYSLLVGPNVQLRQESGSLQYDVHYKLHYEYFPSFSGINDFEHFLNATGSWRFSDRDQLSVRENFTQASSPVQVFNSAVPATVGIVQTGQPLTRQQYQVNDAAGSFVHYLTPTWQVQTTFGDQMYHFPGNDQIGFVQTDSTSMVGNTQLLHALSPRLKLGFGASFTRQDFQSVGQVPARGASFYEAFGVMDYKLTPSVTLEVSGGPALNQPDKINVKKEVQAPDFPRINGLFVAPNTCPVQGAYRIFDPTKLGSCRAAAAIPVNAPVIVPVPFVNGGPITQAPSSTTYFGRASIEKKWERVTLSFEYDRSASAASGVGTSTNLDSLSLQGSWVPTHDWTVTSVVGADRQTSASKVQQLSLALQTNTAPVEAFVPGVPFPVFILPGGVEETAGVTSKLVSNGIEYLVYRAEVNVQRRVNKYLTLAGTADWWQQESKGSIQVQSTRQDFRFTFGFTWSFEPIRLN